MTKKIRSWGYDRIVEALANLGHEVSDHTVGNVLRHHGIPPVPERRGTTTWAELGTDFFIAAEVLTLRGLESLAFDRSARVARRQIGQRAATEFSPRPAPG
jgi:hypothetical protein